MNNMLNNIENTLLIEILASIFKDNKKLFKSVSKQIKEVKKKTNMNKYKVKYIDVETIAESLVYLNKNSIEKIFVQTYIILLEYGNETELDFSLLYIIFSKLGDLRIDELKYLVHQYQKGEGTLEEIYSSSDFKKIANKTKLKALKLFNTLKTSDPSKINVEKLNNLNKGALIKVWGHVLKMLKMINSPEIPSHIKAIAIGALLYAIVPIDAIPDSVPVAGLVDDAAIVTFAFDQISKLIKARTNTG